VYLYNLVAGRLRDHGTYRDILELKNRCLRINYAGNFHLDIIPACPNGGESIKVPDRARSVWVPSNPLGYAERFFMQCQYSGGVTKAMDARVRPLPSNVPSERKYPLTALGATPQAPPGFLLRWQPRRGPLDPHYDTRCPGLRRPGVAHAGAGRHHRRHPVFHC